MSVKFYVEDDSSLGAHEFVPVFHSWIQNHAVPEHMLIDVADYAHVHNGPGTLLVAHEANFYTDRIDGRLGLDLFAQASRADGELRRSAPPGVRRRRWRHASGWKMIHASRGK